MTASEGWTVEGPDGTRYEVVGRFTASLWQRSRLGDRACELLVRPLSSGPSTAPTEPEPEVVECDGSGEFYDETGYDFVESCPGCPSCQGGER